MPTPVDWTTPPNKPTVTGHDFTGVRASHYAAHMSEPPFVTPGNFEGAPYVFVVHEWSPGVEVVQATPGLAADNIPLVNIAQEYSPGMRQVYFAGGLPADTAHQLQQQQAQAYMAQQASPDMVMAVPSAAQMLITIMQ
jgi:hypothetical protein